MGYTLWLCQNSELEHGPVEIVDLAIEHVWFSRVILVYQRVFGLVEGQICFQDAN